MDQRSAPPVTLCASAVGAAQYQPIQRVFSVGIECNAPLIGCLIEGASQSIAGQIAVRLTVDSFIQRALDPLSNDAAPPDAAFGLVVRDAFREANQVVYEYAHRMRAGATIGASMLLWTLAGGRISAGRSGTGEAFLVRDRSLTALFEPGLSETGLSGSGSRRAGVLDRFVGANAKVLVDLATTSLQEGDELLFITSIASTEHRASIEQALGEEDTAPAKLKRIVDSYAQGAAASVVAATLVGYGSKTIELRETVVGVDSSESGGV